MIDFEPYKLIPYEKCYEQELIDFLAVCYAEFEPSLIVELDTLDSDLLEINNIYKNPSAFRLLLDPAEGDKIVGSIAIKVFDSEKKQKESQLKRVFLNKEYRGRGLGKKLSLWAFDYAKEQGCKLAHIWSGVFCYDAHKLYKGLGALDTGEIRCIGGISNIHEYHFVKDLSA